MAKKPRQHKIGDAAARTLHEILDDIAVINDMEPDYGIDFRVQMLDGDKVSWPDFLVQLKGHDKLSMCTKNGKRYARHVLSSGRLADYLDTYREPVFLVVVDVSTTKCFYLFLQHYPESRLLPPEWRKQNRVTVYIAEENDFRDQLSFGKVLESAWTFMDDRHPGSIEAAQRHAIARYQKLDPRFDVQWAIKDGKVNSILVAKEDVDFIVKIMAKGDDAPSRLNRLLKTGLPTEFAREEIAFSGSPLLGALPLENRVKIQFGKTRDIFFSLIKVDGDGREVGRLDGLKGQITSGQEQYHFNAELPSGPLTVSAENLPYDGKSASLSLRFSPGKWNGLPVRRLPFFEQVVQVFGNPQAEGFRFNITMLDSGRVLTYMMNDVEPSILQCIASTLRIIGEERRIAEIIGKDPKFKYGLDQDQIRNIHRIAALLSDGSRVVSLEGSVITMNLPRAGAMKMLDQSVIENLTLTAGEQIDFFSDPVTLGTCVRAFNCLYLVNASEIQDGLKIAEAEHIEVVLEGREGSTMTEALDTKSTIEHAKS